MRQKKLGHKSVANVKKLRYPFLPPTYIYILRIRELEPDPYFFNEEYVSLNVCIDNIEIFATCINQFQSAKKPFKELIKQILCQHIEKKKEYSAIKNAYFDEQKSVKESLIPSL